MSDKLNTYLVVAYRLGKLKEKENSLITLISVAADGITQHQEHFDSLDALRDNLNETASEDYRTAVLLPLETGSVSVTVPNGDWQDTYVTDGSVL